IWMCPAPMRSGMSANQTTRANRVNSRPVDTAPTPDNGRVTMPLRDHFRPPVSQQLPWSTLHAGWAAQIVVHLNERWLPAGYVATERSFSSKHPEIDIATWRE